MKIKIITLKFDHEKGELAEGCAVVRDFFYF